MPGSSYPKSVNDVVATLTDICRHQDKPELVRLLESSHSYFAEMNYDNWNGGTTTWALRLEVPTSEFASVQPRIAEIETQLLQRLEYLDRIFPNDPISEVSVTPFTALEIALGQKIAPSDVDVQRIWHEDYFRLFLSHVSSHKLDVSKLKLTLFDNGISAFVAHEDIEPALEWQDEIALALRSMHALVALITPDFHNSSWTDQEIGWALGRGAPVLPVQLGTVPYGFVGKIQAIRGRLEEPVPLANELTGALLRNKQVRVQMRSALVIAFENADSWAIAERLSGFIFNVHDFNDAEKRRIVNACSTNGQVKGAKGVAKAIYSSFGQPNDAEAIRNEDPF